MSDYRIWRIEVIRSWRAGGPQGSPRTGTMICDVQARDLVEATARVRELVEQNRGCRMVEVITAECVYQESEK